MGSLCLYRRNFVMDVIFVLLIAGVLGYNLVREIRFLMKRRFCTVDVSAHIESISPCGWSKHGRLYRCTVSYTYLGVRYSEEMVHRYRRFHFYEGESLIVKVDENCPSLFLAKKERASAISFLIFCPLFLLICFLCGIGRI